MTFLGKNVGLAKNKIKNDCKDSGSMNRTGVWVKKEKKLYIYIYTRNRGKAKKKLYIYRKKVY